MSTFRIASCFPQDITIISNAFLDEHMPKANGEFVKIYLYLLRISQHPNGEVSLTQIADRMTCTERDVVRAVRYWQKAGLLIVSMGEDRTIKEIAFAPAPTGDSEQEKRAPKADAEYKESPSAGTQTTVQDSSASPAQVSGDIGRPISPDSQTVSEIQAAVPTDKPAVPARSGGRKNTPVCTLTADRMAALSDVEDFRELLFIAEQYMGRPLTKTDHEKICYFYDDLHFSADLIEYLIEYCVNLGHKSIRYIEKVALSWYDAGIRSTEEARDSVGRYHREYYDIFKALGINSHQPIAAEIRIMDKWLTTYGFPMDVITEACTRTVLRTAKPTLGYADGILTNWRNAGVKVFSDIAQEDARHEKDSKSAKKPPKTGRKSKAPGGSFYNFEQRDYDYRSLEARLLNMDVGSADDQE